MHDMHSIKDTMGEGDTFTPELPLGPQQTVPGAFGPDGLHGVRGQPER